MVREWLKRDQSQNRSFTEVERIVEKELIPAWGHRSIKDIGRHDVLSLMDAIADRGAVIMARRVMAYVHRLFRWAVSRGISDFNPAADLPKPGKEARRERVLDDDELKMVWAATDKVGWPYGSAVQLLILTGARRAEISELRWSEVNGESISLKGARTKNGEARNIPLSSAALKILTAFLALLETNSFSVGRCGEGGRKRKTGWRSGYPTGAFTICAAPQPPAFNVSVSIFRLSSPSSVTPRDHARELSRPTNDIRLRRKLALHSMRGANI